VRYQTFLFVPLLLLQAVSFQLGSFHAVSKRASRNWALEASLLVIHAAGYLAVVFLTLPPAKGVAFVLVNEGIFGLYLGLSFVPNHVGMTMLAASDRTDYLRRQVVTSRNIRGGLLTDWIFGGLNYQIEHHLFPSMPRPNLRRAQKVIREFCRQREVAYCETNLLSAFAQVWQYLNLISQSLEG
jgi:fatty acid desaturase